MSDQPDLPAGRLASWLDTVTAGGDVEVPCGACTACCRSSYFVHIGPDETATLARVPKALLFPAPGKPPGHVVLGYDERGHCPMLVDDRCSIYDDRPRTCRTFDCRVFAATGLDPEDDGKPLIAERVRRWRFDPDAGTEAALRAAVRYLRDHADQLPDGVRPRTEGDLATLAVRVHRAFQSGAEPDVDTVRRESAR